MNDINHSLQNKDIFNMLNDLLSQVNPNEVILFFERFKYGIEFGDYNKNVNTIIQGIAKNNCSLLLMEWSESDNRQKYEEQQPYLFQNSRHSTLFISMFYMASHDLKSYNSFVDKFNINFAYIANLSPRRTRPRVLFVVVTNAKIPMALIQKFLKTVWMWKFLDFTILEILSESKLILSSYNPFTDNYSSDLYESNRRFFPNKLIDMKGYPLLISLMRRPPLIDFDVDAEGYPVNINGSEFGFIKIIAEALNFTPKWISSNVDSYSQPILNNVNTTILDLIMNGNLDFGANHVYLHLALNRKQKGERSVLIWVDEYCLLVPVFPMPTWFLNAGVVIILVNVIIHVALTYLVIKCLKFNSTYWTPHNILRLLLSSSVTKLPTKVVERMFFIFLYWMAVFYSTELYALLADLNFLKANSGPYHTLKDLEMSNLTFEINKHHWNMTFSGNEELLGGIRENIKLIDDTINCPERLLKTRNTACFIDKSTAKPYVVNNSNHYHNPKMKLMKPCFWSAPKGIIFSAASPYTLQINHLMQYIFESQLYERWNVGNKNKYKRKLIKYDFLLQSDKLLPYKLIILWLLGCIISVISFFGEFVVNYCNKCTLH